MYEELLQGAVAAARAGGEVLTRRFRDRTVVAEQKTINDLVSAVDRESEAAIVSLLQERFPDHDVLAEEGGWRRAGRSEYAWVVDPLDGTSNYLQGLPIFAVSVACVRQGRVVAGAILDPVHGDLYTAARGSGAFRDGDPIQVSSRGELAGAFVATGYPFRARGALDVYLEIFKEVFLQARSIRRCGAAAIDLAYTASGIYDGFFEFRLSAWDVAAGALLIEEAGGRVSDLDGHADYLRGGNLLAGSTAVHAELLRAVARYADEGLLDELAPLATAAAADSC